MTMFVAGFIYLASLIIQNEASRIFGVFPTPSISHQVVFRPLVLELVKRGHEVVVVTTDPMFKPGQGPANLTEIDVHDMSYETWRREFLSAGVTSGKKDDLEGQGTLVYKLLNIVFEKQMLSREVQSILKDKSKSFDLLLLEAFYSPLLGLSHVFKAPVIQVSSFGAVPDNLYSVGAPNHPLVHPTCIQQKVVKLSTREKIEEFYKTTKLQKIFSQNDIPGNELIQKLFGPGLPTIEELRNNIDMLFLNAHPFWEINRPVPPNVIYMGGIHQSPEQELPKVSPLILM